MYNYNIYVSPEQKEGGCISEESLITEYLNKEREFLGQEELQAFLKNPKTLPEVYKHFLVKQGEGKWETPQLVFRAKFDRHLFHGKCLYYLTYNHNTETFEMKEKFIRTNTVWGKHAGFAWRS